MELRTLSQLHFVFMGLSCHAFLAPIVTILIVGAFPAVVPLLVGKNGAPELAPLDSTNHNKTDSKQIIEDRRRNLSLLCESRFGRKELLILQQMRIQKIKLEEVK